VDEPGDGADEGGGSGDAGAGGGGSIGVSPVDEDDEAIPLETEPLQPATLADAPIEGERRDAGAEIVEPMPEPEPRPELEPGEVVGVEDTGDRIMALPVPRGPCATNLRSRPVGPLQVGNLDGNLGVAHRACPREEVAIGGDAFLVIHSEDFYGNIRFAGRARVSALLFDPRVEAYLSWEPFRYQTVISSVAADTIGLGYLSWGASGQVYVDESRVIAVTGRMVLPTTTGIEQPNPPLAMDLGLTAAWQVDTGVRLHMWVTALGSLGLGTPTDPRGGLRVGGGVDLIAAEWISFVVELGSGFGYQADLDFLAAQGGVRLALGPEFGLELAGFVPFLGPRTFEVHATQIAASLMLSYRASP
jgi:hypothetical protein